MNGVSRLSRNVKYVFGKYNWELDFSQVNVKTMIPDMNIIWKNDMSEDVIKRGKQIRELCLIRDDLNEWILSARETNEIIDYLCTE